MKQLASVIILLTMVANVVVAQEVTPEPEADRPIVYRAVVAVESAFIRLHPSEEAQPVASVFEGDIVEVVARNLDGTWFEVRRPYRMTTLGWIYEEMLEWDFAPEFLVLNDIQTGVEGAQMLATPVTAAVFIAEGVALREAPLLRSPRIINIPPNVTVPVVARNLNASWLRVHYLGYEGWIVGFAARERHDILEIAPLAPDAPMLETPDVLIIPPEVQRAQVERLRRYIMERRQFSQALTGFWAAVYKGEVMPCEAQPPIPEYVISDQDVRQLPELDRYVPRLDAAIAFMNNAIAPLTNCGIISPSTASDARNNAINATIIFDATLERLDDLEENIIR
jgi:hypothetical protein